MLRAIKLSKFPPVKVFILRQVTADRDENVTKKGQPKTEPSEKGERERERERAIEKQKHTCLKMNQDDDTSTS